MKREVEKLMAAHVDGIVIDLRGNGGGSLSDVVDIVGLFIKDGPVVQVKGREGAPAVLDSREDGPLYSGPLAVMVDETSASASEIFAAAIQDYRRGIIIGSSTYGKGTVQRNISLDPRSENSIFSSPSQGLGDIKLTFRKFYRINGGATQIRGVVPDIQLPDKNEFAKIREKDNPDALKWDTIPKVKYSLWNPGYSYMGVVNKTDKELPHDTLFDDLQATLVTLNKLGEEEVPLQLTRYKQVLKRVRDLSGKAEEYSLANHPMEVKSLPVDISDNANDSGKIKMQQQFISMIGIDIYIAKTNSVLNEVVGVAESAQRPEQMAVGAK